MRAFFAIAACVLIGCGGSQDSTSTGTAPIEATEPAEPAEPTEPAATEPVATEPEPEPEPEPAPDPTYIHKSVDDAEWVAMDPEAGEDGPMYAVLSGDPTAGPAMALVKAPENFPGAAHVHSADYRAVVIDGEIRNDSPKKKRPKGMTAGSFWSQPGGAAHLTSCKAECLAFVQFEGAMDNLPADQESESTTGMKAVNTLPKKLKWVNPPGVPKKAKSPIKLAQAWGDPTSGEPNGFFLKIAAGTPGALHTHTSDYHAVIIKGQHSHWEDGGESVDSGPGSYWWQKGGVAHADSCEEGEDCIVYVHMEGVVDIQMVPQDEPADDDSGSGDDEEED